MSVCTNHQEGSVLKNENLITCESKAENGKETTTSVNNLVFSPNHPDQVGIEAESEQKNIKPIGKDSVDRIDGRFSLCWP
jgi:hypothetical protein